MSYYWLINMINTPFDTCDKDVKTHFAERKLQKCKNKVYIYIFRFWLLTFCDMTNNSDPGSKF